MKKLKIIVGGYIGLYPTGGATWDYIQYPLGLMLMGHDVYYIEDTMQYPVYQLKKESWDDCTECVSYLKTAMEETGLKDRWAYRDVATNKIFGMSESRLKNICETADVFINVSASTYLRDEYLRIPVKMLIDTDPMFTQYQYYLTQKEGGEKAEESERFMKAYDLLFSFGLNIGQPGCRIPQFGYKWLTTKKPICLKFWKETRETIFGFTSIMNWKERPAFSYENEMWGQKNIEFQKFIALPKNSSKKFDLIINRPDDEDSKKSMEFLTSNQWNILSPHDLIQNKEDYKKFIQSSFAEFSVTKETYIKSGSGWFSGRSACYLASGKPVLTQDTMWSKYIPAGKGLFVTDDMESAENAIKEITTDYSKHSKAAKEIANEYFDSNKVLNGLLDYI